MWQRLGMIEMSSLSRRRFVQSLPLLALPSLVHARAAPIEGRMVVEDDRLWVGAQIGGEALRFVVDTGASDNFIRPEIAKRLGLANVSSGAVIRGIGNRSRVVGDVEASNVVIAGVVRQPRMQFSTYDFGRGLPGDAAGLFAAGLVTAYDSELMLADTLASWRIWPGGRDGAPGGTLLTGTRIMRPSPAAPSNRIYADATIDGKTYRLLVDTGSPRGLTLYSPATVRSGLWESPVWAPHRLAGFGGAAARLSRMTRATSLELGALKLKRPFVTLIDPAQPSGGEHDGVVGLPIIALLDWSIDPSAGKVWLKRNSRAAVADRYGRSGLWLKREADGSATVEAVGAGSPAAAAGLRIGDTVPDFVTAMRRINGPSGGAVEVAGKTFTLADYL